MSKKYFATYIDKKGAPLKAEGPYYGELTEEILQKMIKDKGRSKAEYIEISRRTNGSFVLVAKYDLAKNKFYLVRPPAGSNYGPGYY